MAPILCGVCNNTTLDGDWRFLRVTARGDVSISPRYADLTAPSQTALLRTAVGACGQYHALVLAERYLASQTFDRPPAKEVPKALNSTTEKENA